ncbi:hypothetical protein [Streptomyces virginiae]|uniref:hypothetical protein n=1 Tax=Streptomyces virginiae TaxID=1961 RepID=UPI00332E54CC
MTDAANTPPTTRAARVLTTVFVVITVGYMGLMTFISVPELTDYMSGRDIDFPVFLAIAAVAGPALFWAYNGHGFSYWLFLTLIVATWLCSRSAAAFVDGFRQRLVISRLADAHEKWRR